MGLLDATTVVQYLVARGVLGPAVEPPEELSGGVSNVVFGVTDGSRRVVLKQALGKLNVRDDWFASEERSITEAEAIAFAASLTPGSVPKILDRDPQNHIIVLERAPADWRDWKTEILGLRIDSQVGETLGEVLGKWQVESLAPTARIEPLESIDNFVALRIEPYYRTLAARTLEFQEVIFELAERLLLDRICFVHGDFSPKNILVGEGGQWIIDFEVSHCGNPAFDPAFLLSHLALKSVHLPNGFDQLFECATQFLEAYSRRVDRHLDVDWELVFRQMGCLMMARIQGKSPVEYLTASEQQVAWRVGVALITEPPHDVNGVWMKIGEGA
jgi:5-methylthioribose kinase